MTPQSIPIDKKQYVVVTGCSDGGMGAALVLALSKTKPQYHIFATSRNTKTMNSLMDLPNVTVLPLDITSQESIDSCVAEISTQTSGVLHCLINNAGRAGTGLFSDRSFDMANMRDVYDTNVFGTIAVTKAFLPLVKRAATGQKKSQIVFNTSVAGVMYTPSMAIYNSSKAAVSSFADTIRLELAPFGIHVVDIKTGSVATKFHDQTKGYSEKYLVDDQSDYAPIKQRFNETMTGDDPQDQKKRMPAEEWAEKVVKEITKPDVATVGTRLWIGGSATICRLVSWLMPAWMLDKTMSEHLDLHKLTKVIQEKSKNA